MFIISIFKQASTITIFVLVMMTILEFFTVQTNGQVVKRFKDKPFWQIVLAALLGIVPGCMGTFAAVSMYIHGSIRFGALVAALIATSGDEAFIMFSLIPKEALMITGILFGVAVLGGLLTNLIFKKPIIPERMKKHIVIHKEERECNCYNFKAFVDQLKHLSWQRAVIMGVLVLFIVSLFLGGGHSHEHAHAAEEAEEAMPHWQLLTFIGVSLIGLFIALVSPNHFLNEHIWGHVIKKHFLKIFLWTFGAFLVLYFLNEYLDVKTWLENHNYAMYIILLIAVLVGMIPESGPHVIFVSLFAGGMIPISVLLANSIVQDGHGAIPLLAESGRAFVKAKIINAMIGLIVGYAILFIGY